MNLTKYLCDEYPEVFKTKNNDNHYMKHYILKTFIILTAGKQITHIK